MTMLYMPFKYRSHTQYVVKLRDFPLLHLQHILYVHTTTTMKDTQKAYCIYSIFCMFIQLVVHKCLKALR